MLKKRGFTLIELLIVIALIGILSAIGIPAYTGYQAKARYNAAKTNHATAVNYMIAEISECTDGIKISFIKPDGTPFGTQCPDLQQQDAEGYFKSYVELKYTNPFGVLCCILNGTKGNVGSPYTITSEAPSTSVGGLTWGYMGFSNFTNGAYAPFKFVTGIGNIEGDKSKKGEVLETVIYVENQ